MYGKQRRVNDAESFVREVTPAHIPHENIRECARGWSPASASIIPLV